MRGALKKSGSDKLEGAAAAFGSTASMDRSGSPSAESAASVALRLGLALDRYAPRERVPDGRTVKVFFSSTSTFRSRDLYMMAEREAVFRHAVPRLWRTLYEKDLFFVPVDLRWGLQGLDEADARAGKLLLLSLREVSKSDYFVGILKGRYGWQQTPGRAKDELLALSFGRAYGEFPGARACSKQAFSEVEVRFGALNDPGARRAASAFYFATGALVAADRHASGGDEDAHAAARLTALKSEIRGQRMRVREYGSAEELAAMLHEDVLAMVARDYPQGGEAAPWLERQRAQHGAYGETRRLAFVRAPDSYKELDGYAEGRSPEPLYVVGESGAGKSALLANWAASWADRRPGTQVVVHHVGRAPGATGLRPFFQRVYEEVRIRFPAGPEADLEGAPGEPEAATRFRNWLGAAAGRLPAPLLLVVDGAEAFQPAHLRAFWVPKCTAALRIVLSSTAGPGEGEGGGGAGAGSAVVYHVPPLGRAQREALIAAHAERANGGPPPAARELLLSAPQCGSPLFLLLALETARFAADPAAAEAAVREVLRLPDAQRAARPAPSSAPPRLSSSKDLNGSESELHILCGVGVGEVAAAAAPERAAPPSFMRFVDFWHTARALGFVVDRGGLWSVDQGAALRAIEEAFQLAQPAGTRRWEAYLAQFFAMMPSSERRALAACHHARAASDAGRLYGLVAELDVLRRLGGPRHRRELASHWRATGRPADAAARYEAAISKLSAEEAAACFRLAAGVLRLTGGPACTGEAANLLTRALELSRRLGADERALLSDVEELASLRLQRGEFAAAEPLLRRAREARAAARDASDLHIASNELGIWFPRFLPSYAVHASAALRIA
eukprot:tig00000704_g3362.t1